MIRTREPSASITYTKLSRVQQLLTPKRCRAAMKVSCRDLVKNSDKVTPVPFSWVFDCHILDFKLGSLILSRIRRGLTEDVTRPIWWHREMSVTAKPTFSFPVTVCTMSSATSSFADSLGPRVAVGSCDDYASLACRLATICNWSCRLRRAPNTNDLKVTNSAASVVVVAATSGVVLCVILDLNSSICFWKVLVMCARELAFQAMNCLHFVPKCSGINTQRKKM